MKINDTTIDFDKIKEAMDTLPSDTRKVFERLLFATSAKLPLEYLKQFVKDYDEESLIDNLIVTLLCQVANKVGYSIQEDMEQKNKNKSECYSGADAVIIAIRELKEIIKGMELGYFQYEKEKQNSSGTH